MVDGGATELELSALETSYVVTVELELSTLETSYGESSDHDLGAPEMVGDLEVSVSTVTTGGVTVGRVGARTGGPWGMRLDRLSDCERHLGTLVFWDTFGVWDLGEYRVVWMPGGKVFKSKEGGKWIAVTVEGCVFVCVCNSRCCNSVLVETAIVGWGKESRKGKVQIITGEKPQYNTSLD